MWMPDKKNWIAERAIPLPISSVISSQRRSSKPALGFTLRQWCDNANLALTHPCAALPQLPAQKARYESSKPPDVWQSILTGAPEPTSPAHLHAAPPLDGGLVVAVSKGCYGSD